jgi:mannose-6-phosphate isomerase-like protein (cupin superfamily)
MDIKTAGDIDVVVYRFFRCLNSFTYVSLARFHPSLSQKQHINKDYEELYYIINGKGIIKLDDDTIDFGDEIFYIFLLALNIL